jgi:predicted nucleotidyltransferase
LIAQTWLRAQHGIDTANVDPTKVPDHAAATLEGNRDQSGKIRLALMQAWDLLRACGDDPLGAWFTSKKGEVQALLEIRNGSILAHGNVPIDQDQFRAKGTRMIALCREALALVRRGGRVTALQLPRSLPDEPGGARDGVVDGDGSFLAPADATAVREFAERVRGALGSNVVEMRLFGSKATGQDVPGSDIDILVVVAEPGPENEKKILAIAFDINLAHDVFISPSVIERAVLEDPVWRVTAFLRAATAGLPV